MVARAGAIASKLAPTVDFQRALFCVRQGPNVGASLLAIAVDSVDLK